MSTITCKFGGTSVATSDQIKKIASIIQSDENRRFVVVSAPGKRFKEDQKVTDLFYLAAETAKKGVDASNILSLIADRYEEIIKGLEIKFEIRSEIESMSIALAEQNKDYAASRGEFFNARIISGFLGATFIDPAKNIFFGTERRLDTEKTYKTLSNSLNSAKGICIIPGFYGVSNATGDIITFSRGGSDITGAIVARAAESVVYENWTDVSGLLMADPRVVENPKPIPEVSYKELRELSYMGAQVLHDEAIFPVRELGIPIHIKNTNEPLAEGTKIVMEAGVRDIPVVGIAGKDQFEAFFIHKALMNKEKGFGRKLLEIFESHDVSFEHLPSGIDTVSVVCSNQEIGDKHDILMQDIETVLKVDSVERIKDLSLIAVVGAGMAYHPGMAATVFKAMSDKSINIRLIDQGVSELTIIIGVESKYLNHAIKAVYSAFVEQENNRA